MNQEKKANSDSPSVKDQSSYRQIFKATSIFGGVQVIGIIISVIRSKFVAVLLGPTGMGIAGLLTSTTGFIAAVTNFGLRISAVKDISAASESGDENQISKVTISLRRLVWLTGILGLLLTTVLSPLLSEITFGNKDYVFAFVFISVVLLFDQLSAGQMVVLQGLRKVGYLARASVYGLALGLVFTVPIYYFFGIDGIVPVIIITSFTSMLLSWHFSKKVRIKAINISYKETFSIGKGMFRMGFMLSLNGMIVLLGAYFVKIYISNVGGVEKVGLFNAGFAILNTYVGMVFTAMGTDYLPRLSAIANDNKKSRDLINQQAEIAILILAPILIIFLVFINWVIILLYSEKFIAINDMVHWAIPGIMFKAASWSIAFIFIAKGDARLFFWTELFANIYTVLLNVLGFKLGGLEGLGISYSALFLIYLVQVYLITKKKYHFSFYKSFYRIALLQFFLVILCFIVMRQFSSPWCYLIGVVIIIISAYVSFNELEKRIGIKQIINGLIRGKK